MVLRRSVLYGRDFLCACRRQWRLRGPGQIHRWECPLLLPLQRRAFVCSNDETQTTPVIGLERWTHAFFMMPHGHEYDAEHAAAAKEGRAPDPAKMRDALGRDMCLPNNLGAACCDPGGNCCATPDPDAGFADYVDCLNTLTSYARSSRSCGARTSTSLWWCPGICPSLRMHPIVHTSSHMSAWFPSIA